MKRLCTLALAGSCVMSCAHQPETITQNPSAEPPGCRDLASGAEIYGCEFEAATRARAQVDAEFERVLASAEAADVEYRAVMAEQGADTREGQGLADYLRGSQAAWIEYSDRQCSLEGETSRGGSGTYSLNSLCHYRMNLQRLSELQAALRLIGP